MYQALSACMLLLAPESFAGVLVLRECLIDNNLQTHEFYSCVKCGLAIIEHLKFPIVVASYGILLI